MPHRTNARTLTAPTAPPSKSPCTTDGADTRTAEADPPSPALRPRPDRSAMASPGWT